MQQKTFTFILTFLMSTLFFAQALLPEGFSDVKKLIPDLEIDLRYLKQNNFVGKKIDGYQSEKAILSTAAARALMAVQEELTPYGLGLKFFDGYRPQRAVNHFVRWAKDVQDTLMKAQFYPKINKSDLFKKQYIATRSGHSRGGSIDLTLIDFNTCTALDMGSPYDFFGEISHLSYNNLTAEQLSNRKLLNSLMVKHGFRAYAQEWWHFTFNNEPFPNTYFDFVIE